MKITTSTTIEDLVNDYPESVRILLRKGIRCVVCGEPVWGTIGEAIKEKGLTEKEVEEVIRELNEFTGK